MSSHVAAEDAVPRRIGSVLGDVPSVVVVFLALFILGALAAGWVGWEFLHSAPVSGLVLLGSVAGTVVLLRRTRPGTTSMPGRDAAVLALPALGVVVGAVALVVAGGDQQLEWFLNGDHPRHVVYVVDTWSQGNLRYTVEGYPRGWHSLLAAAWSTTGAGTDPSHLIALLKGASFASLMLSTLLALATAYGGHALALRSGLSRTPAVAAGVAAASFGLLNFGFANFQALGYQNSLLAAVTIAACAREVLLRPGSARAVLVCGAGTAVVAHSWQLLLPSVAVMALYCAREHVRSSPARRAEALGAALVFGAVAAVGLIAVARLLGLGHASTVGPDTPVPLFLTIFGLLCSVGLAAVGRDRAVWCVALTTLLPAATAVAVSAVLGTSLGTYYPSKLLWHSAVAALPALAVVVGLCLRRVARALPRSAPAVRVIGTSAVVCLLAYGLLMPWGALLGVWSTVEGGKVLAAVQTPGAEGAQVVWLESSPTTDAVTRILLDAYRAPVSRERAPQARLTIAKECALLEAAPVPVVLSTAPEEEVRERYACVPTLDVVRVQPRS